MFEDPAFAARGVSVRAAEEGDTAFQRTLFETARPDAAIIAAWPDAMRAAFLDQQFRFQTIGYSQTYPAADRLIVLQAGEPIGRMILSRDMAEWCIVDIALMPSWRGKGIGEALIAAVQREIARRGAGCLRLTVDTLNPARRLYERLGFEVEEDGVPSVAMIWRSPALN